ncbi:MAG TPA: hypothetical protein VK919_06685 [Solirubrobacterales bacterium]|nr:hypothetical protein [Solirubrobacterales bacterium]
MAVAPRRPGVVTFIGVVLYIYAALAAVAALTLIIFSGNDTVQSTTGHSGSWIAWSGVFEAVVAVLLFAVAAGLMRGSPGIRLFVAIVVGFRMAVAVALMLIYHTGGYLFYGLIGVAIGLFVLWALYAATGADEYFTQQEAAAETVPPPPSPPPATA